MFTILRWPPITNWLTVLTCLQYYFEISSSATFKFVTDKNIQYYNIDEFNYLPGQKLSSEKNKLWVIELISGKYLACLGNAKCFDDDYQNKGELLEIEHNLRMEMTGKHFFGRIYTFISEWDTPGAFISWKSIGSLKRPGFIPVNSSWHGGDELEYIFNHTRDNLLNRINPSSHLPKDTVTKHTIDKKNSFSTTNKPRTKEEAKADENILPGLIKFVTRMRKDLKNVSDNILLFFAELKLVNKT